MADMIRRVSRSELGTRKQLERREWLVTNGLGGYASGTLAGVLTRQYHGLLIAALPAPLGRTVMLNHVTERVRLPGGTTIQIGGDEIASDELARDQDMLPGASYLAEFYLDSGLPVWRYELEQYVLEKRVLMPHLQNTAHLGYRLLAGPGRLGLELRPSMHVRHHEHPVSEPLHEAYTLVARGDRYEVVGAPETPTLRMYLFCGSRPGTLTLDGGSTRHILYSREAERGYDARAALWSPGYFAVELDPPGGRDGGPFATLCVSTEPWDTILALEPQEALAAERQRRQALLEVAPAVAREGFGAELVLAADAFITSPASRAEETARVRAAGIEARTVIAGYHWFTDWGRDTMISLEGLTLATGRPNDARNILRTFAQYVRDGLIPNLFPEGEHDGLYHTADATLWMFHALDRYVRTTEDINTVRALLPALLDVFVHHVRGTRFNIHVDPDDGLLYQGAEGYALTWMDAKVDDWVVTPRRGKAVEINALWYNALCLLEPWLREQGTREQAAHAGQVAEAARQARESFNKRFWYQEGEYLYDVVDGQFGADHSCRPNQLLAISLPHPVLERRYWRRVVERVEAELLTPVGLRTLAPGHPDYKSRYYGDLRARDAAYHQGTVWAWLLGPYVDAYLAVYPDQRRTMRELVAGLSPHLSEACVGSISEIFDAEAPLTPRGCIAQAWSVAEALRLWVATAESQE